MYLLSYRIVKTLKERKIKSTIICRIYHHITHNIHVACSVRALYTSVLNAHTYNTAQNIIANARDCLSKDTTYIHKPPANQKISNSIIMRYSRNTTEQSQQ